MTESYRWSPAVTTPATEPRRRAIRTAGRSTWQWPVVMLGLALVGIAVSLVPWGNVDARTCSDEWLQSQMGAAAWVRWVVFLVLALLGKWLWTWRFAVRRVEPERQSGGALVPMAVLAVLGMLWVILTFPVVVWLGNAMNCGL